MQRGWRLVIGVLIAASSACGDDGGPSLQGPPFFAASLEGMSWVPDTALSIVFASPCDSSSIIAAARTVSPAEEQEITIVFRSFPTPGGVALVDTSTSAFAVFSSSQVSGGFVTSTDIYWTGPQVPGRLTITGVSRSDSVVAGSFSFEAATIPDTTAHRHLSGQFRVPYTLQQVFVTGC